ncbi:hypothetical protein VOLCADRAFT_127387 [Volvox carteri f. nagariensis]|uniref:Ysc84 actin-binding domain-containing protein n=1 Tax=Volvox carteri f. nagariensis TaxID=3068 RepID=D8THV3_VOLCA|nr:uncharacterized protein VOLCADRAFT_127387 [Volvox carteri f. nagariensis]EFJ53129.1 hypothetical protein VOLCADRAFT_127387 [Volvox carteri f. nagariensis]|eukprot:XP_002946134.1 hypothetical protein VOLCADRAFT_127387 [Volvox carteri f. nagariensis]
MAEPASEPPSGPSAHSSHVYEFKELDNDNLKNHLADDAAWASDLITKLITTGGDDAMRPGIVNACEGLAFVKAAKGGLGLTVARGSGFVIRKLDQDRFGNSRWSPPVYFTVSQVGFGAAVGYEAVHSVLALMSYSSILRFTQDKTVIGTDLGLVTTEGAMGGVPAGTFGRTSHMDVQADNSSTVFAYSLSAGLLVNLSINGTEIWPNQEFNNKLYGDTPLEDILNGKVGTFKELLPLYRKISDTGRNAVP